MWYVCYSSYTIFISKHTLKKNIIYIWTLFLFYYSIKNIIDLLDFKILILLIQFDFKVLLGGGRRHWLPKVAQDPEQPTDEGRRLDGRNLIDDWIRDKKKRNIKAEYVWNNSQLDKIDAKNVDYLLGKSNPNYWNITTIQSNE